MQVTYEMFVGRLFKQMGDFNGSLMHAAVGIAGESGEVIDAVKKAWVYNKPLDRANLHEELGDIYFYMVAMCNLLGFTMEDVIEGNRAKLEKRYPQGAYSDAAAQTRADKA